MKPDSSDSELSISLKGQLLLASPALNDGTFDHSVIFLAEHSSSNGAFGAIINHPSDTTVGEIVPNLSSSPLAHLPVHRGGPVSTQQLTFSSISLSPKGTLIFTPRISTDAASSGLKKKNQIIQATVGHSAWSPGQLENELLQHTWFTLKPSQLVISETLDVSLWKKLLTSISPYHALLAQAPKNPILN